MSFKDTFLNAAGCYRHNFGKLFLPILLMQAVMLVPLMFFSMPGTVTTAQTLLLTLVSQSGTQHAALFILLGMIVLILLFLSPLLVSAAVFVIACDSRDKGVTFKDSLRFARRSWWPMLKSYLAAIVFAIPIIIVCVLLLLPLITNPVPADALPATYIVRIVTSVLLGLLYFLGTAFVPYVVVEEGRQGFAALLRSMRCIYGADFWRTLGKLAIAGALVAGLMLFINWLAQLPFAELFQLYLQDPARAMREPLMIFAVITGFVCIVLAAFVIPFWYAFSFYTYLDTRDVLNKKVDHPNRSFRPRKPDYKHRRISL